MSKPFYESPLEGRYASEAMRRVFSPDHRYGTWRRLWLAQGFAAGTAVTGGIRMSKERPGG